MENKCRHRQTDIWPEPLFSIFSFSSVGYPPTPWGDGGDSHFNKEGENKKLLETGK